MYRESIDSGDDDVSDDDDLTIDQGHDDITIDQGDDYVTVDQGDDNDKSNESNGEEDDEDEQFDQDDDSSTSSLDTDDETDSVSPMDSNDIGSLMKKCRAIVSSVRKSSILSEFVYSLAANQSIQCGLIMDMQVRWNSSYKMLKRFLAYQPVLDKLYEEIDSLPGITKGQRRKLMDSKLDGNDWDLINALHLVLERFDEATKVLSGQNYPTLSLSYAIMISLSHYLHNRSDDSIVNKIKDLISNSYNDYMFRDEQQMEIIRVSALLDPLVHDLLSFEDKRAAEAFIVKEV